MYEKKRWCSYFDERKLGCAAVFIRIGYSHVRGSSINQAKMRRTASDWQARQLSNIRYQGGIVDGQLPNGEKVPA